MLGRVVDPLAAGWRRACRGRTTRRSIAGWLLFCCPSREPAPPRRPAAPSPSRTSWPRCGGAPPASSDWRPRSRNRLGDALFKECAHASPGAHVLWCLGRLGARVPLYGPANTVVRKETAERWTEAPARAGRSQPGRETGDAIFALAQLARVASDRARDLDDSLRQEVIARLTELGADETALRPVREYHELETAQQVQALGDSLPIGLRLLSDSTA